MNLTILCGNVGKQPEVRYTAKGTAVANFSVATPDRIKNKETGEWETLSDWHRCVAFGKTAELIEKYVNKGDAVAVQGKTKTESFVDKENVTRSITKIYVNEIKFFGGKRDSQKKANNQTDAYEQFVDDDLQF